MILIADSGGSKTDWALISLPTDTSKYVLKVRTQGVNPFHQSKEVILKILEQELKPALYKAAEQNDSFLSKKDIAEYLEISEEEVMEVMEASQVYHLKSLDVTYENGGEDKEVSLIDVLGDEDKSFSEIENRDFFEKMFQKLDDVEREIIIGRFFKQKTQMKIAEELNISQMTVSRIEKKVLSKIKKEYERTMSEG